MSGYQVISLVTTVKDGDRITRRLENIAPEELREIGRRMNRRGIEAAGYQIITAEGRRLNKSLGGKNYVTTH